VNRFMAEQIPDARLSFDAVLKMAFRRAVLCGAAGRVDEAFECLDQAIAFPGPGDGASRRGAGVGLPAQRSSKQHWLWLEVSWSRLTTRRSIYPMTYDSMFS
jgi:hypothetical protein